MGSATQAGGGLEGLRMLWSRRKWLAIPIFAACFSGASSAVISLPNLYQATATVMVGHQQVPENFVRPSVTGELDTRLQTIRQEILSRSRLWDLITRFNLYPELRSQVSGEMAIQRMRDDILLELQGVDATGGRTATISFALSYRGRHPKTVAEVTNTLASLYIAENLKIREEQATGTAEFLSVQLEEAKKRLDEEEQRVKAFKLRHSGELPEQVEANLATLERLNAQLQLNSEQQLRMLERREALERRSGERGSADPADPLESPATRLARLKRELTELRARYSDKYPDVVRTKAEIAALERDLASAKPGEGGGTARASTGPAPAPRRKRVTIEPGDTIQSLKREERELRRSIAAYQQRVENAPQREGEFSELARDYETTKELYSSLLKRYEDAQLAESMERRRKGEQFRILDSAVVPESPAAPNRLLLMLGALIVSVGMAAAAVLLANHLDTSFHTVEDLRSFTRVPVLVRIPRIHTVADTRRRRRKLWLGALSALVLLGLIAGAGHVVARGNEQLVLMLPGGHP